MPAFVFPGGDQGPVQLGAGPARHRRRRHGHQEEDRVWRAADHFQGAPQNYFLQCTIKSLRSR